MKKVILVRFVNDRDIGFATQKDYAYFTDDPSIVKDDWVIVIVSGIPKAVKVVKDSGITRGEYDKAKKWIVCRIDLDSFQDAMDRRDLVQELENALDEILEQEQRYAIYEKYAESNPRVGEILKQIKQLEEGVTCSIDNK